MTIDLQLRNPSVALLILGTLVLIAAFMPLLLLPLLFVLTIAVCDTSRRAPAMASVRPRRGSPRSRLDRGPPRD